MGLKKLVNLTEISSGDGLIIGGHSVVTLGGTDYS